MHILIDPLYEKEKWKKAKDKEIIITSSAVFLFLVLLVVGIIYSPEDYFVHLIILVVITTIFTWLTIYELSVRMKNINSRYRFFSSIDSGQLSKEELTFIGIAKKEATKEGMKGQLLSFSFKEKGKKFTREIYLLNGECELKPGEKVKADIFSSVLLSYEVISV